MNINNVNEMLNVIIIGAAGSGKGTQGDLIKNNFKLFKIAAGDVLREYRENPSGKYTAIINEYIDSGKMLPSNIINDIIQDHLQAKVFNASTSYKGILFDGFPRQVEQLHFLDKMLSANGNKVDAVIYLKVPFEALKERLSGRFICKKCGEIYHKITKPTKINNVCDVCGSTELNIRADDTDISAIKNRFVAFEQETQPVIDIYRDRKILFEIDGTGTPEAIMKEIDLILHKFSS